MLFRGLVMWVTAGAILGGELLGAAGTFVVPGLGTVAGAGAGAAVGGLVGATVGSIVGLVHDLGAPLEARGGKGVDRENAHDEKKQSTGKSGWDKHSRRHGQRNPPHNPNKSGNSKPPRPLRDATPHGGDGQ